MNRVFSRPLFQGNFIKKYAEGGIVSTVAGPEQQDPMAILTGMAEQVEATEQNLDAAGNIDEILTSFAGTPKTAQDARAELAELVGKKDADSTPESVLALVQPTMAIMEMSRQMGPQGGIASMPMEAAPMEGAAPTNFMPGPGGQMLPAFATGNEVNYDKIMADYAGMQAAIPKSYGADPTSAWLALAQLGAGLGQGKTFAQGLSMGTQMAAPVMQQGIQNVRQQRSELSSFVAAEAQRQKEAAARSAEIADARQFQTEQADLGFEREQELIRLKDSLEKPQTGETERMFNRYMSVSGMLQDLPDDDPTRARLEMEQGKLESLLFKAKDGEDYTTQYKNAQAIVAGEGGDPNDVAAVGRVVKDIIFKAESADGNKLQGKNVVVFDPAAPDGYTTTVANYDNLDGTWFTVDPTTKQRTYLDPKTVVEGTAEDVLTVTPNNIGGTVITIKQGPRRGESYTSSFTKSDGTKVQLGSPIGIGIEPGAPYSVERPAPTVPVEMLNPQTRDDYATKLSGIEQSIRSVDMLLKDTLKTGPLATMQGWMTSVAALTPDQISEMTEFMKTEQGAAQMALVGREIVRARVLSPRFAVAEQQAIREFETQAGPQEFFTNPKAAAVRLGEMLRTMKNEYEYLKGTLSNSPYRELAPQTLGTKDDPFDMSDEQDNAYVNQMLKNPTTQKGLTDSMLFFPNPPAGMEWMAERLQKSNGPKGLGYYVRFGDINGQ
jgi:hypothetical protein